MVVFYAHMDTVSVLLAVAAVFFVVLGVLMFLAFLAILYFVKETHKALVAMEKSRHEDVSVLLDALNAIVDASETTASPVKAAAEEDEKDED